MPKPTESAPLIGPDGELLTPIPVPKSSLLRYLRLPPLIVTTTALTLIGLGAILVAINQRPISASTPSDPYVPKEIVASATLFPAFEFTTGDPRNVLPCQNRYVSGHIETDLPCGGHLTYPPPIFPAGSA
jgi:hypothetical protein